MVVLIIQYVHVDFAPSFTMIKLAMIISLILGGQCVIASFLLLAQPATNKPEVGASSTSDNTTQDGEKQPPYSIQVRIFYKREIM